ncbi:MAG: hypothetical protein ABJA80_10045, partial [bacterium]
AMIARRGKSLLEAVTCMERALALDPEYGLAWAGIAEAHVILGVFGLITPELARSRAVPAAEKAVQFAPDLGDAHCALGIAMLMFDYEDRPRAARAFDRGMALDPAAQGATWYYLYYVAGLCGSHQESEAGMRGLIARDELSAYLHGLFAILLAVQRRSEATDSATLALGLAPDAFLSHYAQQSAAAGVGDWTRCLSAGDALFALAGRTPAPLQYHAIAYIMTGDVAGARAVQAELEVLTNHGERAPWVLACVAAALGEVERAVTLARSAIRRRDPGVFALPGGEAERALRSLDVWPELESAMRLPTSGAVGRTK